MSAPNVSGVCSAGPRKVLSTPARARLPHVNGHLARGSTASCAACWLCVPCALCSSFARVPFTRPLLPARGAQGKRTGARWPHMALPSHGAGLTWRWPHKDTARSTDNRTTGGLTKRQVVLLGHFRECRQVGHRNLPPAHACLQRGRALLPLGQPCAGLTVGFEGVSR